MALTANSTVADALALVNANLMYEGDASKATALLEGLRFLRVNRARVSEEEAYKLDFESLAEMEREVGQHLKGLSSAAARKRAPWVRGRMMY